MFKSWRLSAATIAILLWQPSQLLAVDPKPPALRAAWGDQGDGTYVNPILPGDFSDLDVIRAGNQYVAISSTLHLDPGMLVMTSTDLVNWKFASHAVPDVAKLNPELNWDKMGLYGRGVWAGAIRFHDGKYCIYFGTPDEGIYLTTATDPAGPWAPATLVLASKGWDDPCPFWDDDGQGYLVTSNFSADPANGKSYNIHMFKLAADGKSLVKDSDRIIHQSRGSEANKLYKINGLYYHYYSEVKTEGRVIMMNRAPSLDGPWETRQLNHVSKAIDKEPNQGGLVQVPNGDWWFLSHQGSGDWEGRAMVLLPVTWKDGWPIIGEPGSDGIGNMVWKHAKPVSGGQFLTPARSDDFSAKTLAPQWEWNHAPRDDKWSLSQRENFLRLHAFKPLRADDLLTTGNVLSQRAYRTSASKMTVTLDLAGMADGQEAGLCHFARTYAAIGVAQKDGVRTLFTREGANRVAGPAISANKLYLRSTWDIDGISQFSYGVDSSNFTTFGKNYQLTWGSYRGDRVGVYTFNVMAEAGYLDVGAVQYTIVH
jgi:beta-xylosidase